jgi:hypothetical protein
VASVGSGQQHQQETKVLLTSLPSVELSTFTLQESSNAVRSIVGGIELLMTLLAKVDLVKDNVSIEDSF